MTTTLTVQDRRQAALGRLTENGGKRTRPSPSTAKRERQATIDSDHGARTRRERLDAPPMIWYGILAVVIVFVMLGLVMVLSASAVTQANLGFSPYNIFIRQSMWAALGLVGLTIAARIPYSVWQRLVVPIGVLGIALMAVPFVPGIGGTVNGARAWIFIGSYSIQPSEFLKLAGVVITAHLLTQRKNLLNHRRATIYPLCGIAAVGTGLCMAQGDLGSAIVLGSIVLAIAWIAGVPFVPLSAMATGAAGLAVLFVVSSQTRIDRFTVFLDVSGNRDRKAWQTYQGFVSMASGGVGGSGIGGSKTKLGYLPYAHSDFIFAIIADELGLVGAAGVIGGFVMLVWFGVQTAIAAPDRFGMLIAGGVASWFGVQAIVNIGGVTGLMPVTGLTLPFFSAGGSSLFVSMIATGLLLSVARRIGTSGPTNRQHKQQRERS
jgi:cell division protein FtsW